MNRNLIFILLFIIILYLLYYQSFDSIIISQSIILILISIIIYKNNIEFMTIDNLNSEALQNLASVYNTNNLYVNDLISKNITTNNPIIQTTTTPIINTNNIQNSNISINSDINIIGTKTNSNNLTTNKITNTNIIKTQNLNVNNPATINQSTYSGNIISDVVGNKMTLESSQMTYFPTANNISNTVYKLSGAPNPIQGMPPP